MNLRSMRHLVKTGFSLALVLFATGCFAGQQKDPAQTYWNGFRQAVLASDYQTLRDYTRFPLAVHGVVDGIPVQAIGGEQFETAMKKILDQPLASYEGDQVVNYTQRELISKTTDLSKVKKQADKSFRVGELVFESKGDTYKLVRAYLSE